jgi:hypothetical protein
MKATLMFVAVALLATLIACQERKASVASSALVSLKSDPGTLEKLKIYCYACHNPSAPSHDEILAPPLAAVKMRYRMMYNTREEFIARMTKFLAAPREEDALMFNAVKRFGLMTVTVADEKTSREIVEYIYDNKLDEPAWFRSQVNPGAN